MLYMKYRESFVNDQNRGKQATFDHSNNPVLRLQAKEYVENILHSNQFKIIFDELGLEMPKDVDSDDFDEMFNQIGERAINYFCKNPHKMHDYQEAEINKLDINMGNQGSERIPKTNNIGGNFSTATNPGGPV